MWCFSAIIGNTWCWPQEKKEEFKILNLEPACRETWHPVLGKLSLGQLGSLSPSSLHSCEETQLLGRNSVLGYWPFWGKCQQGPDTISAAGLGDTSFLPVLPSSFLHFSREASVTVTLLLLLGAQQKVVWDTSITCARINPLANTNQRPPASTQSLDCTQKYWLKLADRDQSKLKSTALSSR